MFGALSGKNFVIGAKQVKNLIKAEKASKVYVASDCDPEVSSPVIELAESHNLPVFFISTRKELGEMFGVGVKSACAAETV